MKPENIVIMHRTAREHIITAINESLQKLPAFVIANILTEALSQVQILDDRQYADAMTEENNGKENDDNGNDNQRNNR